MASRVLVVDDAYEARELARRVLEREGFEVIEADDGSLALDAVESSAPDLVLLDLNMETMSGLEVLAHLRRKSGVPVIILSSRTDESDRVLALEMGADDYITKPFPIRELPARVRTVLRRAGPAGAADASLVFGDLEIRLAERELILGGQLIPTTSREFDVLAKLASAPRRVFSRETLLREVWSSSMDWQDPATVTEHIRRLRLKIEADPGEPKWIVTVRGAGYRFEPPEEPAAGPGQGP